MKNHRIMFAILTATILGLIGAYNTSTASAATTFLANKCGTQSLTTSMLLANWTVQGINDDEARLLGVRPVDETLAEHVKNHFHVFTLARDATIADNGCKNHGVVPVGPKKLKKGTKAFGDGASLDAKYGAGNWSPNFKKGWKKRTATVPSRAMTTCDNPISGPILVLIWVRPTPPAAKPGKVPVTPTGNCNVINSPGANACSTITYVSVCGTQVVYNGDMKDVNTWTQQYIKDHCQPTVTTTVCSDSTAVNFGQAGPCVIVTTVPVCPSGTSGTPPNCVTPPVLPPPCLPPNSIVNGVCTAPPPPPAPKPLVEVNTVQEITASDYSVNPPNVRHPRFCGSVKTQPGDLLKVSFSGHEGTFDNPNMPDMTADGTKQQVCNTYTSGTEVGTAIDWITISVVDVTAKTSNSADSNHFDVVKADSNPSNP